MWGPVCEVYSPDAEQNENCNNDNDKIKKVNLSEDAE
jgi:hypothetical protein